MEVKSEIENVSENAAAMQEGGILEFSTFSKGDSWATCK